MTITTNPLREDAPTAWKARWVFVGPEMTPWENATVISDGQIITDITTQHMPQAIDLGNSAILPGLINAHTHLEFSDCTQPLPTPIPFTHWIRDLMAVRNNPERDISQAIAQGLRESQSQGISVIGEIATWPEDQFALWNQPVPHTIAFRECLGLKKADIADKIKALKQWITAAKTTLYCQAALSPHAPYSLHPELFQQLIQLSISEKIPVAMHLAETPAEVEFVQTHTGDFRNFLERIGLWDNSIFPDQMHFRDYLESLAQAPWGLVIHGNYLTPDDIQWLSKHPQLTVVYCPRTHHYFGHPQHPFQQMQAAGVRVILGTDSRGSNPNLSIYEEAQFLRARYPEIDPRKLLQMLTLEAAKAMQLEKTYGSIEAGKSAQLAVVRLPTFTSNQDPWDSVFHLKTSINSH
jgi:cytosine/adenosine deaminase-related metal-dependent hydrolase